MTEPKFTPGPWEIDDRGYGYAIEPSVCWIGENSSTTPEQLKANAHLILAAPEMYNFLSFFETILGQQLLARLGQEGKAVFDEIEKLLRKARGESEVSE